VVLVLCSQIAYMLDKYFIKKYVVILIFTQYVLCENTRLVSTTILFGSSNMVSRCLDNKQNA
jgi:predicted transglutaminase-like protease